MANRNQPGSVLRPRTEVLTRGFDPRLSVGSARPAVFRSSTYVFSNPEAAERAFDLTAGRIQAEPDEQAKPAASSKVRSRLPSMSLKAKLAWLGRRSSG